MRKNLVGVMVFAMILTIGGCVDDSGLTQQDSESTATTEELVADKTLAEILETQTMQGVVSETQKGQDSMTNTITNVTEETGSKIEDINVVIPTIKYMFDSSFGNNVEVTYEESLNAITISVWKDGIAKDILLSSETEETKNAWHSIKQNMISTTNTLKETFKQVFNLDVNINIQVLNDINTDNILLSIYNDVVIYDILE